METPWAFLYLKGEEMKRLTYAERKAQRERMETSLTKIAVGLGVVSTVATIVLVALSVYLY